ncbi:MAG: hypothetical protein WCR42_11335 [bacterium]
MMFDISALAKIISLIWAKARLGALRNPNPRAKARGYSRLSFTHPMTASHRMSEFFPIVSKLFFDAIFFAKIMYIRISSFLH